MVIVIAEWPDGGSAPCSVDDVHRPDNTKEKCFRNQNFPYANFTEAMLYIYMQCTGEQIYMLYIAFRDFIC